MNFPFEIVVNDENGTKKTACRFAQVLSQGDVVLLIGNLGAGKTLFIKALGEELGISNVSSPSFAIVNEYSGKVEMNHFDFYRIKKVEELYDIGINEYLADETKITVVEWADMFEDILPVDGYRVFIEHLGDNKRKIRIDKNE